jgi:uncharacterized damage-inducible protein DinB
MVERRKWFERQFALGQHVSAFPEILERLRGTPARLEERVRGMSRDLLTAKRDDRWSIQENVGHLADLEPLWLGRLEDFAAGAPELRVADLQNRKTYEADHNRASLADLLTAFRAARLKFVTRVEELDDDRLARSALHPRLRLPMTVVDHCFFVAEHDDFHLATITELSEPPR